MKRVSEDVSTVFNLFIYYKLYKLLVVIVVLDDII